jgi:fumarate hydratase class I
MWTEKNTGDNLPAQIELYAADGDAYKLLFMAKGGGSANKSYLYQETKALLNPKSMRAFLEKNLKSLGTAACPPYHLAIVIGGTSAEYALKTAKYASARYLDSLPTTGNDRGRGFRDIALEAEVLALTQELGIGAQFGGKYFCHDVRVVRLPRHGASCPVAIAVSCSADRQALGQDHEGRCLPRAARVRPGEVPARHDPRRPRRRGGEGRSHAPDERDPRAPRQASDQDAPLALGAHGRRARHRAREDQGAPRCGPGHAAVPEGSLRLLRRPAKTPTGMASGSFGPTTAGAWTATSTRSRPRAAAS